MNSKDLAALLKHLRSRAAKFNDVFLGRPPLWSKQLEVARSFLEVPITLAPSGHATGKTYLEAGLGLHYLCTNPNSVVLCYAPSARQLQNALWPEIKRAWNSRKVPMPGRVLGGPSPRIEIGDKWYLQCLSADGDSERLQGVHAGKLAILCDEASWAGYDSVLESILSQSPERLLLVGNPIRKNIFHRLTVSPGDDRRVIPISSLDSPHIGLDRSPFGLADRGMLAMFRSTWGEDSPVWRVRILGQWAEDDEHTLIPDAWLARCLQPHTPTGDRWLSVDLSAGTGRGDLAVILVRDYGGVLHMEWGANWPYPTGVAEKVRDLARRFGVPPGNVIYDAGGLGVGFHASLKAVGIDHPKAYIGGATCPSGRATRFRGACCLQLRDRLDPAKHPQPFAIRQDWLELLRPEITGLRYSLASSDKVDIEPKALLKGRLGHSPDRLDGLIQSFGFDMTPPPKPQEKLTGVSAAFG